LHTTEPPQLFSIQRGIAPQRENLTIALVGENFGQICLNLWRNPP
jgi:hypothetical protein